MNCFCLPSSVFYFEGTKDLIDYDILINSFSPQEIARKQAKHKQFVEQEQQILSLLSIQENFIKINLNENKHDSSIITSLKPELIFALPGINP